MSDLILDNVKSLFETQIKTLNTFKEKLPEELKDLILNIYNCKGKVVITGLGKSGHISRKIAATMSSTGTPAIYLHPTESLHGDIGVVTKDDIVIFISKSGENAELNLMIPSLKKIGTTTYSLTSNKNSSLALSTDSHINLGHIEEICPLDLAPTTSATLCLMLMDSVAMEVMRMRNFSKENYAIFHPSGRLGRRLLFKVKDVMTSFEKTPQISKDATVQDMLNTMTEGMAGSVLVTQDRKLLGLITDNDVRRNLESHHQFFDLKIVDIMNNNPDCCQPEDNAYDMLIKMRTHKTPRTLMPVVDQNNNIKGLLRLETLIQQGLA